MQDVADVAQRTSLRVAALLVGAALLIWLAGQLMSVLLLVFVALILAAGALGPVTWLEERRVPTPLAVFIVYLAFAAGVAGAIMLVAPPVVRQLVGLVTQLPAIADSLARQYESLLAPLGLNGDASVLAGFAASQVRGVVAIVPGIPVAALSLFGSVMSAIFLSAFLLLERHRAKGWIFSFVAEGDRVLLQRLVDQAALRLGAFIRGQLAIMTFTGLGSAAGLAVLGIPFPVGLGVIAFLAEAIPLAGPTIAGVAMVGVALLQSLPQAGGALLLVIALQQIEGLVLVPLIQGRAISLSPSVALVAVLSGSVLAGIVGALVAIPFVAISKVVTEEVIRPWRTRAIQRAPARAEVDPPLGGDVRGDADLSPPPVTAVQVAPRNT